MNTLETLQQVIVEALGLAQEPAALQPGTPLFGVLPELDSFGVLALVTAVEDRFDITIEDDEFGAELFETVGTLHEFIEGKL
jgi:acyl carrier protein